MTFVRPALFGAPQGHFRLIRSLVLESLEPRRLLAATVSISDSSVIEGSGDLVFTVMRTGDLSEPLTVGYSGAPGASVTFEAGSATTSIVIPVTDDARHDLDR